MSQNENVSFNSIASRELSEEYFDMHPNPWDVETYSFLKDTITLYMDCKSPETFLLKIRFSNWMESKSACKLLQYVLKYSTIDVYRNNKELFLRKLLF